MVAWHYAVTLWVCDMRRQVTFVASVRGPQLNTREKDNGVCIEQEGPSPALLYNFSFLTGSSWTQWAQCCV